jgi:uncharacterized OB-fold protein
VSVEGLLLPPVDATSAPFWEGTRAGELRVQKCAGCGRLRFPPRPMCPWCRSVEVEWKVMSGRATVWSFVIAHPPLLPAYAELAPYNCVVVTLDEDPTLRMVGNLLPLSERDITIGEPVRVAFDRIDDEITLPRWERA